MCAPWAHGNACSSCRELRPLKGPDAPPHGEEFRCEVCYADGALSDPALTPAQRSAAVLAADKTRDIFYTAHAPSAGPDRILAVELQRRHLPTPDDEAMWAPRPDGGWGDGASEGVGASDELGVNRLARLVRQGREAALGRGQHPVCDLGETQVLALMRDLLEEGQSCTTSWRTRTVACCASACGH